jgi:hypothetical protein
MRWCGPRRSDERVEGHRLSPRRIAIWAVCASALLLVFLAYLRPDMAMTLALQLWNCF